MYKQFEDKSAHFQAKVNFARRHRFMKEIKSLGNFHLKTDYINKKIEFDQRFFNTGYREYQIMISDIRA